MKKKYVFGIILALLLASFLPAQQKDFILSDLLLITPEDMVITYSERGGYGLYIRKKPAVESVQIFLPERGEAYPLLTGDPAAAGKDARQIFNRDYNGEAWFLLDSTAENYDSLGDAFYIYIPPVTQIHEDPPDGTMTVIPMREGLMVMVRAFSMKQGNSLSHFRDTPFIIQPSPANEVLRFLEGAPGRLRTSLALSLGLWVFNPGPEGYVDDALSLAKLMEGAGSFALTQGVSDTAGYRIILERDAVLLNRLIIRGVFRIGPLTLEAGPFLGFVNPDPGIMNPGVSALIRWVLPQTNTVSAHIRFDTSLGSLMGAETDYRQELQEFNFAWNPSFLLLGVTVTNRKLIRYLEEGAQSSSGWIRYQLSGLYINQPYNFSAGLTAGYQELNWYYSGGLHYGRYRYQSVYLGVEAGYRLQPSLDLTLYAEAPVWPLDYLDGFETASLFNVNLGIRWTF